MELIQTLDDVKYHQGDLSLIMGCDPASSAKPDECMVSTFRVRTLENGEKVMENLNPRQCTFIADLGESLKIIED